MGEAVDISGDIVVVGSFLDSENGTYAGAAYVFRFDGSSWIQEQKLMASDGANYDRFGGGVAVTAGPPERIAVAAPFDDDNGEASGSAYVFRFEEGEGWVEEAKLKASDGSQTDQLGRYRISMTDTAPWRIVIGARGHDDPGTNAGSAYVFRYDDDLAMWTEEQKLQPDDSEAYQLFGRSVAISGVEPWRIVVGAQKDDNQHGVDAGAAYVFVYDADTSQWLQDQKLLPDDGEELDRFGRSVSISGDVIVTGSNWDNDNGEGSGSAYLFRFDPGGLPGARWVQEQKLFPADAAAADHFGTAVAVEGDTAVVGKPGEEYSKVTRGSVHVFRYDTGESAWIPEPETVPPNVVLGGYFGFDVAADGDLAAVSALEDDSVHVLDLHPALGDLDCDGQVGVTDFLVLLAAWGLCPDPCPPACPADLDQDCTVGVTDFLVLLANWTV
jgi:hypothetical protein